MGLMLSVTLVLAPLFHDSDRSDHADDVGALNVPIDAPSTAMFSEADAKLVQFAIHALNV